MIKELLFREIQLQINASLWQRLTKSIGEEQGGLDVYLEVSFGNCYERVHTVFDTASVN